MNTLTATGYLFNPDRSQILLIFHKKLGRWLPPGGHVDGGELPHLAVLREVYEETGIRSKIVDYSPDLQCNDPHTKQIPAPFCMHYDEIPPYGKEDKDYYTDLAYVLETENTHIDSYNLQIEEVDDARWFTKEGLRECDTWEIVKSIAYKVLA